MLLFGFDVDGVIFDCDGVLADTEPLSQRAWAEALDGHGAALSEDAFVGLVGGTERQTAERFAPELGVPVEALERAGREALLALLSAGVEPFDDAVGLLDRLLGDGAPVAVASNSFRWRLDAVLDAAGLLGRVAVTVAGDEVAHPKPAPDVYLESARRLGLSPGGCLVIEDSPPGIEAGRRAGMVVVAVDRGMFPRSRLSAADRVVATILEAEESAAGD